MSLIFALYSGFKIKDVYCVTYTYRICSEIKSADADRKGRIKMYKI